jgi:hypothetical protein
VNGSKDQFCKTTLEYQTLAYDGEEEENDCENTNPGETHGESVENNEEI